MHFLRNILAQVPKRSAEMVAAAVRTIFAQPDAEHVREQLDVIATMLGRQPPQGRDHAPRGRRRHHRLRRLPRRALEEDLVDQPPGTSEQGDQTPHRRRRRLPQPEALLRLAGCVPIEVHDQWQVAERRYLSEASMALIDTATPEQTTPELTKEAAAAELIAS